MNDSGPIIPAPDAQPANPAAVAAMNLRPMSFSQVLDRIFHLLRTNFRLLTGIALAPCTMLMLVIGVPVGAFQVWQLRNLRAGQVPLEPLPWPASMNVPMIVGLVVAYLAMLALCSALYGWYVAAGTHGALAAEAGRAITIRECYRLGWQRIGRYFGLVLLRQLLISAPILAAMIPLTVLLVSVATLHGSAGTAFFLIPLAVLAYLGALAAALFIALQLSLAFPAAVAEDLPVLAALRRSTRLTRGSKSRIFLVMLIVYALCYMLELVCLVLALVAFGIGVLISSHFDITVNSAAGIAGLAAIGLFCVALGSIWISITYAAYTSSLAVLYRVLRASGDAQAAAA